MPRPVFDSGNRAERWIVQGTVQGVGFRAFVVRSARRIGLAGYVRNQPDGNVEVWVEGSAADLEQLAADVRRGPSTARVERLDRIPAIPTDSFDGFEVRG